MKNILAAVAFFLIYSTSFAQEFKIEYVKNPDNTVSRGRMENGKKTGLWVTYDSQSNPKRMEEYKDGERHGYFVENDEHGHPFMEGWFNNGKPVGKHTIFSHGVLLRDMDFDLGTLKEYYESSSIKKESKIKNGQPDGTMTQYYEDGSKLSETNFVEGKKTGLQKFYYQTGGIQAEYSTVNDELSGPYKDYHSNGKTATEGVYEKNQKQGVWKEYDESGKLIKQTKYKNDTEVK